MGLSAVSLLYYGGYSSLFVSAVSIFGKMLSMKYEQNKYVMYLFRLTAPMSAVLYIMFFNVEGYLGYLPAMALMFVIVADSQSSPLKMNYIYLGSSILWVAYTAMLWSVPGLVYSLFIIFSIFAGIRRIDGARTVKNIENNL